MSFEILPSAVQNSVKTNVSRPLSKPRVRNPITSKIKEHSSNLASIPKHADSPTQLEREFLASSNNPSVPSSWGDNSWDEEYFKMIPEDTTILNSSLSSSLSSLCASRETESAKTTVEVSHCVCTVRGVNAGLMGSEGGRKGGREGGKEGGRERERDREMREEVPHPIPPSPPPSPP